MLDDTNADTTTTNTDQTPAPSTSMADLLDGLRLYGAQPGEDEPDPRPAPEPGAIRGALGEGVDGLAALLTGTLLEPDLEPLLWALANLFHRRMDRLDTLLDDNEREQRRSQQEQDGSEVRSVELERLLTRGANLIARRDGLEQLRDAAGDLFEAQTGSAWRPRAGSLVSHRHLTATLVDSRDFLAARRRAKDQMLLPKGTPIAFAGGAECNDHARIWSVLDRVRAKHPDMVLLHGASPKGAERIAACWADSRKVAQVAFRPDWTRHAKAAPFKRNDAMIEALPAGVIVFPGSGITDNLADKARKVGIPVWRFEPLPA